MEIDCDQTEARNYLALENLRKHFAEKVGWTARPTMLLESECLECTWELILAL